MAGSVPRLRANTRSPGAHGNAAARLAAPEPVVLYRPARLRRCFVARGLMAHLITRIVVARTRSVVVRLVVTRIVVA